MMVVERQPQLDHVGLQRSLQVECLFMQWATANIERLFTPLDEMIARGFLPPLIGDDEISDHWCTLMILLVRKCGMALPYPTSTACYVYDTSHLSSYHRMDAIVNDLPFNSRVHLKTIVIKKQFVDLYLDTAQNIILEGELVACGALERRTMEHKKTHKSMADGVAHS